MPRYFFDLHGHEESRDELGTELSDAAHARVEAVKFTGSYLSDHPELVWDGKEIRIIVRDENRRTVFTVVTLSVDCD